MFPFSNVALRWYTIPGIIRYALTWPASILHHFSLTSPTPTAVVKLHRFKEDPEYGQMLKRMWNGDLTTDDCKRINSRVIEYNCLQLPSNIEGEFKKRKCQNWKNTQKCAVTLISCFCCDINFM